MQDNESWEKAVRAAHMLSELERRFEGRKFFSNKNGTIAQANVERCETQLKELEIALDKLLSSFHSVVFDPIDAIYSSSLCTASSNTATECSTHMLAVGTSLKAVNNSIDKFAQSIRDAAVFLSDGTDLPSCCLNVSELLDALETQLTTLEGEVAAFKHAALESDAALGAINAAYTSLESAFARQGNVSSIC
ncbi:hypothetical protein ABL78_7004 [Leptomonas seymouri]|uniref:Uncharacterized protein n=1 Tax=Leptomonas seymouri TaxID=5684 RepID=A0A0N0P3C0_LEPSE|nr:hypothetical protein ABL78_7004 [Leptomonas seymouri]|eukprot:KPI83949.1 hypothetical protein ABL78_7004 [Leptomonas seymouri]